VFVPVDPPGHTPIPEALLSQSPAALATKVAHQPTAETVTKAKEGLLFREPKADGTNGRWYQSVFWWAMVGVTALGAFVWITALGLDDQAVRAGMMASPFGGDVNGGGGANWDFWIGWFGWVYYAWIPLGIGLIGALQAAGYRRLAAAWSVTITGLIALFFARNNRK
jgi:hypothetical protein